MRPRAKYAVIYQHRNEYPVSIMCRFFQVARSGYYDFVHRMGRPEKDAALAEIIAEQRERSLCTYGYRRMWLVLKKQGIHRNPKTIYQIISGSQQRTQQLSAKNVDIHIGVSLIFHCLLILRE